MLRKITIENYRCYSNHIIEFKDLSVIVGKNNAGKSTLVEALRLVSLALSRFRKVNYHNPPNWLDLPQLAKGISPSLKSFGFNTENLFHNYGRPPSLITAEFTNAITVKIYVGENAELFCILKNKNEYVITKGAANSLDLPQVNILPQISTIQKEERVLNKEYVKQNLSTELASLHFRNQLAILNDSFPRFVELSQETWNGLRIHPIEGGSGLQGGNDKLSLLVQDGAFVSEIGWMGSGLQMWLQIMWFISRISEQELIILDEPDVYMHPELQRKLIRLLKSHYKYVIVSTHSVEIISEVEPSNILIIDKHKDRSLFANKIPVVQRILNSIGSIHNLQLTKLWASKKLVIVEGDDISILKRLQNILFPKSDEPFDSIPNFDIGGWGGWNNARGSSLLLKETVDDDVKIFCIFDSDYHTIEEINGRVNEANRIKINIHIWSKKELENYLIIPNAILRIIKKESKKSTSNLTVVDIENVILELAKSMEEDLIDKIADAIQKQDRKLSVSVARTQAKSKINNIQDRVCGKALISALSKWTQENYTISLSPIKLANQLLPSEIDTELKRVISSIENCIDFEPTE